MKRKSFDGIGKKRGNQEYKTFEKERVFVSKAHVQSLLERRDT